MPEVPAHVVDDIYTKNRMMETLEELTELENRMPGQAGEEQASKVLARELSAAGLRNVERDGFEMNGWWRGSSTLVVEEPHSKTFEYPHEVVALPGTPPAQNSAELVDLGYGTPEDFEETDVEGRIVLAAASDEIPPEHSRRYHRTEKYAHAAKEGAAGFIYWTPLDGALPSTGWVASFNEEGGSIPAVGVSKELGQQLARYCGRVAPTVSLAIDCKSSQTKSHNVEAVVGPDTEEEVLVTAHLDAHDLGAGARDNGAGSVLAVEIGRLLASMESELETKVRIVVFGAEEAGHRGARHWTSANGIDNIKCVANIDGAGDTRTLELATCGFDSIGNAFEEVSDELSVPIKITPDFHAFADQWAFVQRGAPGIFAGSAHDDEERRWGIGRLWSHTHADTLDKIEIRDLRALVHPLLVGVVKLAEADRDVPAVTSEKIRDSLDPGMSEMLQITGRGYALD